MTVKTHFRHPDRTLFCSGAYLSGGGPTLTFQRWNGPRTRLYGNALAIYEYQMQCPETQEFNVELNSEVTSGEPV